MQTHLDQLPQPHLTMGLIENDTFVCLDVETTGLDPALDRIVEIAVVKFSFSMTIDSFTTLVDPQISIPESSIAIHHITQDMVQGKPTVDTLLAHVDRMIGPYLVVGHGIDMDLSFLAASTQRAGFSTRTYPYIDTLRLARLYGGTALHPLESFSLDKVRQHFNLPAEGAHRAMGDVTMNIGVFKALATMFKTTEQMVERLKKPILLRLMPLGKHKGRPFNEIPLSYLKWAAQADFDQDLMFSIRSEIQKRNRGERFEQAANPFSQL